MAGIQWKSGIRPRPCDLAWKIGKTVNFKRVSDTYLRDVASIREGRVGLAASQTSAP